MINIDMKHKPRKRFGQNFLHDTEIIGRIIGSIQPQDDQHLIEIGPGQGALTDYLLKTKRLDLIELDRDLVKRLQHQYQQNTVHIHQLDALKLDIAELLDSDSNAENSVRLIGNLPYNISTPLIFHLLDQASLISDMHFMLQKEVADRLAAQPGNKQYGRLTIMTQYHCAVHKLFDVPAESFFPAPKVCSSIVRLLPHRQPPIQITELHTFNTVVSHAFAQRRKTLRNTLSDLLTETEIHSLDIDSKRRAETLSLQEFANLTELLTSKQQSSATT